MPEPRPERLVLARATAADMRRMWRWRNEPLTRAASFRPSPIAWREHQRWYGRALRDRTLRMYVIRRASGQGIGYLRAEIARGAARLSLSIAPRFRARGFGVRALQLGVQRLKRVPRVRRMVGLIKARNVASQRAFARAGFRRGRPQPGPGGRHEVYEMRFSRAR